MLDKPHRNNAAADVFDADLTLEWEEARRNSKPFSMSLDAQVAAEARALRAIRVLPPKPDREPHGDGTPMKTWSDRILEFLLGE